MAVLIEEQERIVIRLDEDEAEKDIVVMLEGEPQQARISTWAEREPSLTAGPRTSV